MKTLKKTGVLALSLCLLLSATPQKVNAGDIKLNKTKVSLYSGSKTTLKVTGTTKHIMWSSSDQKVATVNNNGVVRGKKIGSTIITARVGSGSTGKTLKCKVTVKNKIIVPKSQIFVTLGEYEEIVVKDRGLKSDEYISFFEGSNKNVNFEWDTNNSKDYNILIAEGQKLGRASVTLRVTDNWGVAIGSEKHTIDVYVLRDNSGWISWKDLKSFADVDRFTDEDEVEYNIDSRKGVSDSGIAKYSLSFILPNDIVEDTVYLTNGMDSLTSKANNIHYKMHNKQLYFSVQDLLDTNLI